MKPPRVSRLAAVALATMCAGGVVSACGSVRAGSPPGAAAETPRSGGQPARAPFGGPDCQAGPNRRAWAELRGPDGRLLWRTPLPTDPTTQGVGVQPLDVAGTMVAGEYQTVYGLSGADGHQLWRWTGGQLIYGLWPWQGTVVVLSGQVSDDARLAGLDAATGAVRWSLQLPRQGLYGSQALTGDGGLAMLTPDGTLEVADLATGRLRWSHQPGGPAPAPLPTPEPAAQQENSAPPVAVGPVVVGAVSGRAVGYDSRTGAQLWTATGLPGTPSLAVAAGLILVTSAAMGPGLPTEVTALSPATGRVAWRLGGGPPQGVVASGPAGILLSSLSPDMASLLDPATGRARWQAATVIQYTDQVPEPGQVPGAIITSRDVISIEGRLAPSGPGGERIVDRSASDGSVRWTVPIATMVTDGVPPLELGTHVVVVTDSPTGRPATLLALDPATGRRAWQATLPTMTLAPPAAAGGDVLAQSADPSYGCASGGSVPTGSAGGPSPAA